MASPNIQRPEFEPDAGQNGFVQRRYRVGRLAGCQRLGASLYELPPGSAPFPYHLHYGNEELLIVVSGGPSLRTPEGWRELEEGDVVALPAGEAGAHQVANRGEEPARVLIVSEMVGPEVLRYPDSRKVGVRNMPPGAAEQGFFEAFGESNAVGYWDGESPPNG